MALRKVLTPELARKSSNISIRATMIVVDTPKRSKTYGVVSNTKAYAKTPENLKVANRYK